MIQNRILIVLENGAFKAASATSETGSPAPLDLAALNTLAPDINTASLARIEELEAEIAALKAAPAAPPVDETAMILSTLDEAFETLVPETLRPFFEVPWVTVRNLLQADKRGRAILYVTHLQVPAELREVRDRIVSMLSGDDTEEG